PRPIRRPPRRIGRGLSRRVLLVACERVPFPRREAAVDAVPVGGVLFEAHGVPEAFFTDGAEGSAYVLGGFCVDADWWVEVVVCWPDFCTRRRSHPFGVCASGE